MSIISDTSDDSPEAKKAQNFELEYLGSHQFALGSKHLYQLLKNSISSWLARNSELTEPAYKVCLKKIIDISDEKNFVTGLEANKLEEVETLEKNIIDGSVMSSALKKPENQKYRTIGRQSLMENVSRNMPWDCEHLISRAYTPSQYGFPILTPGLKQKISTMSVGNFSAFHWPRNPSGLSTPNSESNHEAKAKGCVSKISRFHQARPMTGGGVYSS